MINNTLKNNVHRKYNQSITLIFFLILIGALLIAGYRYYAELSAYKSQTNKALLQVASALDNRIQRNEKAVLSIQKYANYYLALPHELSTSFPNLIQDGENFYLDKQQHDVINHRQHVSNNITGKGAVALLSPFERHELKVAHSLTPAFVNIKEANEETIWMYYVSFNRFVSLYPWINRQSWHYTDKLVENPHVYQIQDKDLPKGQPIWSSPYLDSAGSGLSVAVSKGVYLQGDMLGAIVVDISLSRLHQSLPMIENNQHGFVLINTENEVLIHKTNSENSLSKSINWQTAAPDDLKFLSISELARIDQAEQIKQWFVQKAILSNGWFLVKYQPYNDFVSPVFTQFIYVFGVFFLGSLSLLFLVYWRTHRTFIQPTRDFINHIAYSAQGDLGKIKPPANWHRWFHLVEDIFGQNRSLMNQLTEQNSLLDSRVLEKTEALQHTIKQHQRDYALLTSVMNAIPEYILFTDINNNLVGFNEAFEQFVGDSEHLSVGRSLYDFLENTKRKDVVDLFTEINQTTNSQRIVRTEGLWFEVFDKSIANQAGKGVGQLILIRDVTQQHYDQLAIERAKEQAEFANNAKSQFLANMSHEIRTPINAIQGMISLLSDSSLSKFQQSHLTNAEQASHSLLYLVDDILDFAKIDSGNMRINISRSLLDKVIHKAVVVNYALAQSKKLSLSVEIPPHVPCYIQMDEMRVIQVLTNLISNAIKFTHAGSVCIKVSFEEQYDNSAELCIHVIDTGIGIALEKQASLFEAFEQVDVSMTREYGGSGLGLAISKQIMDMLGGEIRVNSELNQGSEFVISLPITQPWQMPMLESSLSVSVFSLSPQLILPLMRNGEYSAWQCQPIEKIEQLPLLTAASFTVLLVGNLDEVTNLSLIKSQVSLLAICSSVKLPEHIEQQLIAFKMPFIILDKLLYRYSLFQINTAIKETLALQHETPNDVTVKSDLLDKVILLVEDNLINQMIAKALLEKMNAQVIVAENGKEAIALINLHQIDVVIMDIQMPVMDGLTATKIIRQDPKYSHLPIIAMTAHARDEDREKSLAAGMNAHLVKPINSDELLEHILAGLEKQQTSREE